MMMSGATSEPVLIDLALQGGGSHGAFTWGVLDRLLEEPRLEIVAISGTSAGAMNAAVLAAASRLVGRREPFRGLPRCHQHPHRPPAPLSDECEKVVALMLATRRLSGKPRSVTQ